MTDTKKIKDTIIEFIDDMESLFENSQTVEKGECRLVKFFFQQLSPEAIATHAKEHLVPHKTMILTKNIQFFDKNKENIFKGLPKDRVDYYAKYVIDSKNVCQEDIDVMFRYFKTILVLCGDV